jgi:predicted HAD superfamily Cof-like phosphohydrolase
MANTQTQKSAAESRSKSRAKSDTRSSQGDTGERDENYNLISVLYHALQGAETITQYVQSSRDGDEELVEFLKETRQTYQQAAAKARELLADRLSAGEDEDEDDEDE